MHLFQALLKRHYQHFGHFRKVLLTLLLSQNQEQDSEGDVSQVSSEARSQIQDLEAYVLQGSNHSQSIYIVQQSLQ